MIGYKLTSTQADAIRGRFFNSTTTFNPQPDINGYEFIFEGEVNGFIEYEEFFWVKDLIASEYVPPLPTNP